ncbi:helix-turn-helix domain-containing protein [Streptococcus parauberis]|uniref:helix-turn-helix domain-containing protein n=1 Tax=Streptococcus parauberis TaxID=1348 RepID=UPI000789BC04|nr:helix-turn-helix transcriptional regulator [Streptococcus parauberis]QBX18184.1 DNA-binding protein [Streptococcus phage Javan399]KYP20814.1 hypothetical protein AKL13_00433 [Streptococcus parauberis]KYP21198.1 hypothetical protein TN39_00356 [Streptococcus parauberis]KYP22406.1 hypothetical protein AKL14_00406 [Streptococcus parauberis]KYP24857.1 hypothetical protein ADO04_01140 [Streptococcus parauberis]
MNNLKQLRQERGLTQQGLSEETGIPIRSIQNWENGKRQINPESAKQLADYFEVDLGYLYGYQPINVIQDLISENELLRDENQRLTKNLNEELIIKDEFMRELHC